MILSLTKIMDWPRFSTVSEYKGAWKQFRRSKSGKLWIASYWVFLATFLLLSLEKFGIFTLGE